MDLHGFWFWEGYGGACSREAATLKIISIATFGLHPNLQASENVYYFPGNALPSRNNGNFRHKEPPMKNMQPPPETPMIDRRALAASFAVGVLSGQLPSSIALAGDMSKSSEAKITYFKKHPAEWQELVNAIQGKDTSKAASIGAKGGLSAKEVQTIMQFHLLRDSMVLCW
jgi:hypothetical protein